MPLTIIINSSHQYFSVFSSRHVTLRLSTVLIEGMPNKIGENPRFLRNKLMEVVYPAAALAFIVLGVAELLAAWF